MLHGDKVKEGDKKLLALEREYIRLNKAKRDAPVIPLEQPYQKGWTKRFALREDIARSNDGAVLKMLLGKFNTTIHCMNREFKNRKDEPLEHHLKILPKKLVDRLKLSQQALSWMHYGFWSENHGWRWGRRIEGYVLATPSYYFVDDIQPYMITHRKVLYPEVESRVSEIQNKLERDNLWPRLNRLHFGSHKGGYERINEDRELNHEIAIAYGTDPEQW